MRFARSLTAAVFAFAVTALPALAAFETRATAAWVYDVTSDTVLLSKNADQALPPASMSKLMTLNMLFEALRDNPAVSLDTQFTVSSRSQAMGGSTMMLQQGDRPTVEDLIRGVIVQSGNDATVAIAEGLAGTETAFAQLMNQRAKALGMKNSSFGNASGWPHPAQRMSMADLGLLATRLITEFPEYYGYFSMGEYHFKDRAPANRFNRNPLLPLGIGADGLKTGHTQEAGYGLTGSAKQGDRRIVFVITGLDSAQARAQESERIVNWAMRQFVERQVLDKGTRLADAPVHLGEVTQVGLVAAEDLTLLLPLSAAGALEAELRYTGPVLAPVTAGQPLGELVITRPGLPEVTVPLVADADIAQGGMMGRVRLAARQLWADFFGDSSGANAAPAQ